MRIKNIKNGQPRHRHKDVSDYRLDITNNPKPPASPTTPANKWLRAFDTQQRVWLKIQTPLARYARKQLLAKLARRSDIQLPYN